MIVAAIAWGKLTPAVRREVSRLLTENPDYPLWIAGVDARDRDAVAFIEASRWPDEIKANRNYDNSEGEHPRWPFPSGRNIGYADRMQHRYWHFYDTPFSPDGTRTRNPDRVNALTQILLFTKAIAASTDDSVRSYDVVWLIHLVGDVHQPLHAVSRFDADDRDGDSGGNRVTLCSVAAMRHHKRCRGNLHNFWDDTPGANRGAAAARVKAGKLASADPPAAMDNDPHHWIEESFQAAKKWAYAAPVGVGDGPWILTAEYRKKARAVAKARLALAGARLANLLNRNLRTSP